MSNAKHTPGPWVYNKGSHITSANGWMLASAWHTARMPDASEQREPGESWLDASNRLKPERDRIEAEMEANARLIAYVPELLEALKTAHAHIADDALRASIGNLIAKAEAAA
jgi:broad specificity phosphatase PhoE